MKRRAGQQPRGALDVVFDIASILLAARGEDPDELSARAQKTAKAVKVTRDRLETFIMGRVRESVDCRAPDACMCLVCTAFEEAKRPDRSERMS